MGKTFARGRLGVLGIAFTLISLAAAPAHASTRPARLCSPLTAGFMHCNAFAAKRPSTVARAATVPAGYGPSDLQDAYSLAPKAATLGADKTVAIVDAYDDPNAESDLAAYRAAYGLPPCDSTSGCFRKVDESGGTNYPTPDYDWAGEIALDLDMVSAVCPNCKILLVEASSNSASSLFNAVDTAASLGASAISNSWGGPEFSGEWGFEPYFDHPGVPITVSTGDSGFGVEYPAASAHVTAVGGTTLTPAANARGWRESAWAGAGSGCSAVIAKPAWQHDTGCARRTVADVSAVADPSTPVAVYNTYDTSGGGWWQAGGTSAAAPIVAAAFALLGDIASSPAFPYEDPTWFNDAVSGSNGDCALAYLCEGLTGFDGPTGVGTPNLAHAGDARAAVASSGDSSQPAPPPTAPPPAPPAPPVAPAPPAPAPLRSSVAVAARVVKVSRSGRVTLRIRCGQGPSCRGVLKLQTPLHGAALALMGKARYSVAAGKTATVTVRLSRSAMRLLNRRRRLRAYGTALDSDGTTAQASFVLHAPRKRRARHR